MTDRYVAFLVTLREDMREDDAEDVIKALSMNRFVETVTPVGGSDVSLSFLAAEQRVKSQLREKMYSIIDSTLS